jgi:hypothetical protein
MNELDFNHRKIAFQKVNEDFLVELPEARKAVIYLYANEGKTYHPPEEALNKDNNSVNVCDSYFIRLNYAVKT